MRPARRSAARAASRTAGRSTARRRMACAPARADTHVPLIFLDGILVTPGGFSARDRTSTGGTVDAQLIRGGDHHVVDGYAWLGVQGAGDQTPPVPNDFTVRTGSFEPFETLSLGLVATGPLGPLLGGKAWYAAGIAPTLGVTTFDCGIDAPRRRERRRHPRRVSRRSLATAPIELDLAPHVPVLHPGDGARRARSRPPPRRGRRCSVRSRTTSATLATPRSRRPASIARPTSATRSRPTAASGTTPASASSSLAPQRAARERARSGRRRHPRSCSTRTSRPTLPDDPALAAACRRSRTPTFDRTARSRRLVLRERRRRPPHRRHRGPPVGDGGPRAPVRREPRAARRRHVEDTRLVHDSRFTGGERDPQPVPRPRRRAALLRPEPAVRHHRSGVAVQLPRRARRSTYRTRYTAAYVEDTFTPAPEPRRRRRPALGAHVGRHAFHFSDELAPRLGIAGTCSAAGGRACGRAWAAAIALPAGRPRQTVIGRNPTVDDHDLAVRRVARDRSAAAPLAVAPGIQPIDQDELTAGIDVAPVARYVKRDGVGPGSLAPAMASTRRRPARSTTRPHERRHAAGDPRDSRSSRSSSRRPAGRLVDPRRLPVRPHRRDAGPARSTRGRARPVRAATTSTATRRTCTARCRPTSASRVLLRGRAPRSPRRRAGRQSRPG